MDRVINYDGEVPATLDVLNTGKSAMVGIAFHNAAMFGSSTVIQGLACTPTVPTADMYVNIASGSIYALDTVDATAYGDLGTDAAIVVKQGILYAPLALLVAPPSLTSGQSVNILVEVGLVDADDGSTVVQYYNPANPASPLWGSNFAATQALGTPQNTTRLVKCNVQLKNGTAATTGSQTTPSPDAGYIGLYVITVPVGYTQILSTYIKSYQVVGATANGVQQSLSLPYFPNLPAIPPDLQDSVWTYATDTGSLNAMAATCYPLVTALIAGLMCQVKAANTNTSTVTFNLNGLGAKAVHRATGVALSSGDITSGELVWMMYDGTAWQIVNFYGPVSTSQTNYFNTFAVSYGNDHGTTNNLLVSPNPAISSLAAGQVIAVKVANTNTDSTTLTLPGLTAVLVLENQLPLLPAAITAGEIIFLEYDGTIFQKQPQRWPYYPSVVGPTSNANQYLAINDQATISFTAASAVPLNIACVPGVYEIELVASANNSTKSDIWLLPNDTSGGSFNSWQVSQSKSMGVGAIYAGGGYLASPSAWPQNQYIGSSAFAIATALGGADSGPFMLKLNAATSPEAKMLQYFGAIAGAGSSWGFSIWNDTTTVWTSLGTLLVSLSGGVMNPAATLTGVAIVRRLA